MYDFYSISYGIRNVSDINKTLKEAYRVLKPGGRFMCLEFSKIQNSSLNFVYKNYSKLIPAIGKLIVGEDELHANKATLRDMESGSQEEIRLQNVVKRLSDL